MKTGLYGINVSCLSKDMFDRITEILEEEQMEYETWYNNG